ncbi:signal peptidase I [Candidatus Dependentiae bacterium]|nr:signal peptidase I [Candidatus Dependentiae bacterium]
MTIREVVAWIRKPNKTWREQIIEFVFVIVPVVFLIRTVGFGLYQVPTGSMETTMLVGERFFADKLTPLIKKPHHGEIISFNDPLYPYADSKVLRLWQYYVWGPSNWTKRVIGMPGDHMEGRIEHGKPVVYRNGERLEEPYLNQYPLIATYDPNRTGREFTWQSWNPEQPLASQSFYRMTEREVALGKQIAQRSGHQDVKLPQTPDFADLGSVNERIIDIFDVQLQDDEYWAMGDNRLGSTDSRVWGPLKAELIHGKIIFRLYSIDSNDGWWIFDLLKHPIDFWSRVRWSRFLQPVH